MLRDKLNRLSDQINPRSENSESTEYEDIYHKLSDFLKGQVVERDEGSFVKVISDFDQSYIHGSSAMFEMNHEIKYRPEFFAGVESETEINPEKLLFFDMETTGLGGAGTVAFLVGLGSLTKDGFQVRQYFLPDFPDEAAMLEEIRSEFTDSTIVVSYNGKSFDMPILRDRMIIQRVERKLDICDHIDLLHSTRKLFRLRLGSCTLGNIEREVLSFYREGDVPGELVPGIYFNWLATSDTELIDKVVEHNLNDIVSLYFLMHRIAEIHTNPVGQIRDNDDLMSLVKIYEKRKENDRIVPLVNEFEVSVANDGRLDILLKQALAAKRLSDFDAAVPIWEKVARYKNPDGYSALIELAKYYEHRAKNIKMAHKMTCRAVSICPPGRQFKSDMDKRLLRLEKRLARLDKSK